MRNICGISLRVITRQLYLQLVVYVLQRLHKRIGFTSRLFSSFLCLLYFYIQIKGALFMCLQRDPRARVSSLNLWKFMVATGDSGGDSAESTRAPSAPAVAQ